MIGFQDVFDFEDRFADAVRAGANGLLAGAGVSRLERHSRKYRRALFLKGLGIPQRPLNIALSVFAKPFVQFVGWRKSRKVLEYPFCFSLHLNILREWFWIGGREGAMRIIFFVVLVLLSIHPGSAQINEPKDAFGAPLIVEMLPEAAMWNQGARQARTETKSRCRRALTNPPAAATGPVGQTPPRARWRLSFPD
jgi:hypothetical protein